MKTQVLYIGGYGRSGSTIIGLILGQHNSCVHFGEFGVFWSALKRNRVCTCGSTLHNCDFWGPLLSINHSKNPFLDLHSPVCSPRVITDWISINYPGKVIIDSTKTSWINSLRPFHLFLTGHQVYFIHLYRPLSQVLQSALKGSNEDLEAQRPRQSFFVIVLRTTISWSISNFLSSLYRFLFMNKYFLLNFNHVLSRKEAKLRELCKFLPFKINGFTNFMDDLNELSTNHEINGNRLLRSNSIRLKINK